MDLFKLFKKEKSNKDKIGVDNDKVENNMQIKDMDESEIEIFRTDNFILFEQICQTLKNSNIKYIDITNKGAKGVLNYTNFLGKIIVLKDTEKEALKIIQDVLKFNNAPIDDDELPKELKEFNKKE